MNIILAVLLSFMGQQVFSQEQINELSLPPYNQMGFIIAEAMTPRGLATRSCTGTLISRTHVLTDAHCLNFEGTWSSRISFIQGEKVRKGINSKDRLGEGTRVKNAFLFNNYVNPQPPDATSDGPNVVNALRQFYSVNFDISVFELESPVDQPGLAMASAPTVASPHCFSGFPGDLKGQLIKTCGTSANYGANTFFGKYTPEIISLGEVTSFPGQSGAAVLNEHNAIVGVVRGQANMGAGCNPTVFISLTVRHAQEITLWMQGQTSPASQKIEISHKRIRN